MNKLEDLFVNIHKHGAFIRCPLKSALEEREILHDEKMLYKVSDETSFLLRVASENLPFFQAWRTMLLYSNLWRSRVDSPKIFSWVASLHGRYYEI